MKKLFIPILMLSLVFSACMKDDKLWKFNKLDTRIPTEGIFIINEGNFMTNTASLDYYNLETKEVIRNAFFETNKVPLGDVAQSMVIRDSLGYIVINNSGKIYVINIHTFKLVGKITGLISPRYIHFLNDNKAYVTDLYAKSIAIINPLTYEVTGTINVNNHNSKFYQHSTEQMIQYKNLIFTNCWSYDNQILVINTQTDQLVDSIKVPIQPTSMVIDKNNKIWVVNDGGYAESPYGYEAPSLTCIDAKTRTIEKIFHFKLGERCSELTINKTKDTLYFINNDIYRHPISSKDNPQAFIKRPYTGKHSGGYYGLAIDPFSSDIFVADAIDYIQEGIIYHYKANGTLISTFKSGVIPGAFCFKPKADTIFNVIFEKK